MQPALIMLSALVLVGTVLWLLDRHSRQRDEDGKLRSESLS